MTTTTPAGMNTPDTPGEPGEAGGRVLPLRRRDTTDPATGPATGGVAGLTADSVAGSELVGPVLEAELVDEDDDPSSVPGRPVPGRPVVVRPGVGRVVATVRSAERPVVVGRAVLVVGLVTGQGVVSWGRRVWDAATWGVYRRQIRSAEAAGDQERLRDWTDAKEAAVARRHQRWMDLPELALGVARVTVGALVGLVLLVLLVGLLVQVTGAGQFTAVVGGAAAAVRGLVWLVTTLWTPLLVGVPVGVLVAAYREGARRAEVPAWLLAPATRPAAGGPITPSVVVTALRDLGVAELRAKIKQMPDAGAGMLGPIRIAGCGVEVDVTLPGGVSTDEVQRRRRKLAENMDRHEHEVFITIPPAARTVRLWIADSGALDEPIGPSPLVIDPDLAADLYTGRAPWGQDLRGDQVAIALLQRHLLITGLSNQGKTAALRALALWLALDPTVELRIADLKGAGDWRMFDGLASTLIQGPTDEHVIAATHMLEAGVDEMERRIAALEASGATDGVTRDMARALGAGFHPLFLLVDEAQIAFMCPAVGADRRPYGGTKATSRYFMAARKLHNQGRVVNVHLWQGTQDPTDQNLPKLVREGAHIRASLVVGSEPQARMALGDKAVNGGAAPHKLRQGADKGTLVVAGDGVPLPTGQAAITIRTHYIDGQAAADIAARARTLRTHHPTRGAVTTSPGTPVDHLADIAAALRDEDRVPTRVVLARLVELNPVYEAWDFTDLTAALADHDITPVKTTGIMKIRAADVHQALTERDNNGAED